MVDKFGGNGGFGERQVTPFLHVAVFRAGLISFLILNRAQTNYVTTLCDRLSFIFEVNTVVVAKLTLLTLTLNHFTWMCMRQMFEPALCFAFILTTTTLGQTNIICLLNGVICDGVSSCSVSNLRSVTVSHCFFLFFFSP